MKLSKTISLLFFLFIKISMFSQNSIVRDSIEFNANGFNSSYTLKLFSNNTFNFEYTIVGCLITTIVDENGNEVTEGPDVTEGFEKGFYYIDGYKITFESNHFFTSQLKDPMLILPVSNKTFLISSNKEELERIKSWRDDFKDPFPVYLFKMNEKDLLGGWQANEEVFLSEDNINLVYSLFE